MLRPGEQTPMNYRFQKLTTIYDTALLELSRLYSRDLSYEQLYNRLIEQHYGWADYYAQNLRALGNEASEIFANFQQLQELWAAENGVPFRMRGWFREIVAAQVKAFQPDVIFLEDLYLFDYDFRQMLRASCSGPVMLIGWRGAPTEDFTVFNDIDVLLTCSPGFVDRMRQQGLRQVHLFYPAFEPSLIGHAASSAGRDLPLTFVGSLVIGSGFHNQRYAIIERLMESTPLEVWGEIRQAAPENGGGAASRLTHKAMRVLEHAGVPPQWRQRLTGAGQLFNKRPESKPSIVERYPDRIHEPAFGLDNLKILSRSRITLNRHIDCSEEYAGNVRLFEATGMGACLLTDSKINLGELFETGTEVVDYDSAEECLVKAGYLLDHPNECAAIGAAGQQRALRDHTFAQRTAQLDQIIHDGLVKSRRLAIDG